MFDDCYTQEECIEIDLDWVKNELKGLTKEQRCTILREYIDILQGYRIGMAEYKAFVNAFDELEE